MRPFGFYEPTVASEVKREGSGGDQDYRVIINVTPGDPVVVDKVEVKVTGPGADDRDVHQHHRRPADPDRRPAHPL